MNNKTLICTSAGGTVIAAICCFTPALVLVLGAAGLSAWLGWIDYVLLPALVIFAGLTLYAATRILKDRARKAEAEQTKAQ